MARRDFRRGAAAIRTRRETQWFRSTDISSPVSLAGGAAIIDQSLAGFSNPITVVRTRGSITIWTDQEANDEDPFGACGMCVVSDQALAIGVSAVPTPITDKDSDLWIMHQYFGLAFQFVSASGSPGVISQRVDFDSKAMRKIPPDTTLIWAVENASASAGLRYLLQFAVLIKLS